jgi:stringent starvation protein B
VKDPTSTTPYLIRAIWEWCGDNGLTPYVAVKVDGSTRVPLEFVRNGEIVLNISAGATRNLKIGNDLIQFSARFNGVSREVSVPIAAVAGIFAKENGQGMAFHTPTGDAPMVTLPGKTNGTGRDAKLPSADRPGGDKPGGDKPDPPPGRRPRLQVVK